MKRCTKLRLNGSDVMVGLEKDSGELEIVRLEKLLERLNASRYLPQFAFLVSPYFSDMAAMQGLTRMARSMVEASGLLAAVAASGNMSSKTLNAFSNKFYRRLRTHGMVDWAYSEACAEH